MDFLNRGFPAVLRHEEENKERGRKRGEIERQEERWIRLEI